MLLKKINLVDFVVNQNEFYYLGNFKCVVHCEREKFYYNKKVLNNVLILYSFGVG